MPPTTLPIQSWTRGAPRRGDLSRSPSAIPPANGLLPLDDGHQFHRGMFHTPTVGTAVLRVRSPRPLRVWVDGQLLLDEPLSWRSFQHRIDCAMILPLPAGEIELIVEVGVRPRHPERVDEDCPSRNRETVMSALKERFPEILETIVDFHEGVVLPAIGLRFSPGQFHRDGTTWQEIQMRTWPDALHPPASSYRCVSERNPQTVTLETIGCPGEMFDASAEPETSNGVRRLFIPIGRIFENAPLRGFGPDPRPEPELEIAKMVTVRVTAGKSAVELPMPAYESTGRQAPLTGHRLIAWPDADTLLATVPAPILPAKWAAYGELYRAAWKMIIQLVRHPLPHSGLPNDYLATAIGGFEHHVFVWDSSFTAMATAYGWRAMPHTATLDMLYSRQQDGGYIHRENDIRDGLPAACEPDFSPNPPLMAVAELAICRLTGDTGRLKRVYPALVDHHRWLDANRRLPDGTFWTTGLANGLDNSPSLGEGYPDLTSQMAHHADCLAQMAALLGRTDESAQWICQRDAIGHACNERLWCEQMRLYSTSLKNGGHNPNKVVTGFWPLWAGIVPPERVELLAQELKNPASFWRHHPVPSLAADSPEYRPGGDYWKGSTWAPTNFAVVKGFQRAGRLDLAREVTHRHLTVLSEILVDTGHIWENFCAEKSERGSWSMHDYSWSAVGPIALLLEVVLGLEPDAPAQCLRWTPPEGEECGVERYPLGPGTIGLRRQPDGVILVTTTHPFILEVVCNGNPVRHSLQAGEHTIAALG